MSRNNLLLSLLANNPNSRSNSLANREGLSPTMSFFPRSTSNSLQKVEKKEANKVQTSTQLIRFAHMLNVKVKQSYYFVFCKLEQIYKTKKSKADQCKVQQTFQKKDNQNMSVPIRQVQEVKTTCQVQKPSIPQILNKVCEWHSAFSTKIKARTDNISLRESFNKILKTSKYNHSLFKIYKVLKKRTHLHFKTFFDKCSSLQNAKIKIQIMIDTLNQFTHKLMFSSLRNLQTVPYKFNIQQHQSISSFSKCSQTKTQPHFIQTSVFETTSLLTDRPKKQSNQTNTQKVSKCMKIKIKQKNTTISKPIKIQSLGKLNKALKFNLKEPSKIIIDESIFQDTNQPKNVLINLHQEHLNIPIPDFSDSCSIFRTLPDCLQEQFCPKNTLTTQPLMMELRKSVEMLPTEDGSLTERTKINDLFAEQKYNKSATMKHNSLGKLRSKKVINIGQSPLKKVEELYKTVQQFNSITATNKQKKLININLPNFINTQSERVRPNKTPLKEQYEQAYVSHSKGKQNTMNRQRLFTEREKQKLEKVGLQQSGTKYKSSMLTRDKKVKADKVQLSTARKMKMQIENIISRRNKQLGRNQIYQLK